MKCKQFVVALEDYLGRHPGALAADLPHALQPHASACPRCQRRWSTAARSRLLLGGLRPSPEAVEAGLDPFFLTRLQARIYAQEHAPALFGLRGWQIAGRDLVLAAVLFAGTLGSFLYNFHRIETPNADEAMVLDVPHLNPQHPSDDHVRPKLADVMLNLMNP
ncbi:MAG TPA: hypothetical protein VMV31_06425 [Terriglobales bacterium]|nr:hypothetical protein [Terriglobales bacterium]